MENITNPFAFTITRAASSYRSSLARAFQSEGFGEITPDYFILLYQLWNEDNISIGDLAHRTSKDGASISRIVEGMSKKNLVKRVKNSNDIRFSRVILTKKGNELKAHLPSISEKFNALATKGLSPIEVKELQRMLEHVYSNTGLNKLGPIKN